LLIDRPAQRLDEFREECVKLILKAVSLM